MIFSVLVCSSHRMTLTYLQINIPDLKKTQPLSVKTAAKVEVIRNTSQAVIKGLNPNARRDKILSRLETLWNTPDSFIWSNCFRWVYIFRRTLPAGTTDSDWEEEQAWRWRNVGRSRVPPPGGEWPQICSVGNLRDDSFGNWLQHTD